MKKTIDIAVGIIGGLTSFVLYAASGKKIKTRYARRVIARNRFLRSKQTERMQAELDRIHRELRGWTATDNRMSGVRQDAERDAALKEEFTRTISANGFRCRII